MNGSTRVWVTRDEGPDGELCSALRAVGLEAECCPVVSRRVCADVGPLVAGLAENDWLVLTSRFAIETLAREAVRCRVAVVGRASEAAARAKGWRVERVSPDGTGLGLWDSLRRDLAGARRVCYPRSSRAPLPAPLGAELAAPVLYETVGRAFDFFVTRRVDLVAVASPSVVEAIREVPALPPVAALGPTTGAALRRARIEPWLEARDVTFEEFAAEIAEKVRQSDGATERQ